jgi:outer membrane protein assembly factor BamB
MFFDKAVDTPAGFVGCWDDATGELRWKIPGYYYIGYFSTFYDDGKVYAILQDNRGLSETEIEKGTVKTLSACIDAMTGQIIYTMPFELGHDVGAAANGFRGDVAIAYGVLFVEYYNVLYCISDISPPKDWPNFRGYLTQNAVDVTGSGPSDISYPKWSFKTGAFVSATPAVAEGKVFVGSQDGKIYCLDAYTGALIWNYTTNYRVQASCAYSGGKVYTGADDGIIRCFEAADGTVVWEKDIGGKWADSLEFYTSSTNDPASSPIIVGDKLYVGAKDGKFYCLSTANGAIQWSTQTYGPILGSPCYYQGKIFTSSIDLNYASNGGLYCLDALTGAIVWHVTVSGGRTGFASTPIIAESIFSNTSTNAKQLGPVLICGAGSSNQLWSFNITSGARNKFWNGSGAGFYNTTNWFISQIATGLAGTPFTWAPAVYNNTVFGSGGLTAAAWNYTNSRVIWSQWLTHNIFVSPLVTSKGYKMDDAFVYYGADSGALSRLNANNATKFPISAFQALGLAGSSFAMWEQKLYVGHGDYNVYCFDNSPSIPLTLFAAQDKGATMWSNETLTITGRLNAEESFDVAADPALGVFEPISEKFKPGVANATMTIVFVKPDLSSTNVTVLTDKRGYFTTTFNPDIVGTWSWTAWYQGKEFPNHSYRYDEAYSEYTSVEVTSPTAGGGDGETTPTATPPVTGEGVPMEYVYAAIAAIAIVLIAIGAYAYTKRSKKPTA